VRVYVVFSSHSESTTRIARSIASSVMWSNEYEARQAAEVNPGEIHGPGVIFLGYPSGGPELDRAIRSFLDRLPERTMYNVLWAVFDTRREPEPAVAGSAVRRLRRAIEHRGGRLLVHPESFYVGLNEGVVPHRELERARAWGASAIASAVRAFRDTSVQSGFLSGGSSRPEWAAAVVAVPS